MTRLGKIPRNTPQWLGIETKSWRGQTVRCIKSLTELIIPRATEEDRQLDVLGLPLSYHRVFNISFLPRDILLQTQTGKYKYTMATNKPLPIAKRFAVTQTYLVNNFSPPPRHLVSHFP